MTWGRPTGPVTSSSPLAAAAPARGGACPSRGLGAADDVGRLVRAAPEDRVLHAGAFNWTYTLGTGLMDPWAMGATALVVAPGAPPWAC